MKSIKNCSIHTKPSSEGFGHFRKMRSYLFIFMSLMGTAARVLAQDNYEIQVYASETVAKDATMVELHSNFNFGGARKLEEGVLPTYHVLHETIEITHGFTHWFETGIYLFNAIGAENQTSYVGSHIRPRARIPEEWRWPVGLSLSAEIGYQKPEYSTDDWTLEIRPIIDKYFGKLYLSLNPVIERSLHGPGEHAGYTFSPDARVSYKCSKIAAWGVEYYGALGPVNAFVPYAQQQHQLFVAVDLEWSEDWEFNAGYGVGLNAATTDALLKVIVGYRFHKSAKKGGSSILKAAGKRIHFY